jgi:hypothetical protein
MAQDLQDVRGPGPSRTGLRLVSAASSDGLAPPAPSPSLRDEGLEEVVSVARHFFPAHAWMWITGYGLWCPDCGTEGASDNLPTECLHPHAALCDSCLRRPAAIMREGHAVCGSCAEGES